MSDHKCTKWFQGYCVDCQIHYTDCIESLQAKHTGLLKWAEGAKLDNEGLKSRIGELEGALNTIIHDSDGLSGYPGKWPSHIAMKALRWTFVDGVAMPPQEPKS